MADFTSNFWHWFIVILVVLSFVGIILLVYWMSENKKAYQKEAKTMGHVWDGDLSELNNPLPLWWLGLFILTIVFGVGYLVLYPGMGNFTGLLGWTQEGQYDKEVKLAEDKYGPVYKQYQKEDLRTLVHNRQAMRTGARLFGTYCSTCHGSDARGAPGFPNLRDRDWLYGGDPETIKKSIMDGRKFGIMPPWGAALKANDGLFNVTEYVLGLSGHKVNTTAAGLGKEKFKQLCAACHGPNGRGDKNRGAPNLTDNVWLYGGSQATVMESIAKGRNGKMPAHRELLGEAKVHLLAAYIYSLSAENLKQ